MSESDTCGQLSRKSSSRPAPQLQMPGLTQQKISALSRCELEGFSVERLMNPLTALDQVIEIVIRRKPRSRTAGRIDVVVAQ